MGKLECRWVQEMCEEKEEEKWTRGIVVVGHRERIKWQNITQTEASSAELASSGIRERTMVCTWSKYSFTRTSYLFPVTPKNFIRIKFLKPAFHVICRKWPIAGKYCYTCTKSGYRIKHSIRPLAELPNFKEHQKFIILKEDKT